jgi:cell division protein FtsB
MNKHKPKFMKIVPPGQQKGTIAPPYAWDGLERSDWSYEYPKRRPLKGLGEGESDHPAAPKPAPLPGAHHSSASQHAGGTATAPKPNSGRHARVDAIQAEIKQIRADIEKLTQHKQKLTQDAHTLRQKAKDELQGRQKYGSGAGTSIIIGDAPKAGGSSRGGNVITVRESDDAPADLDKGYGGVAPWKTPIEKRVANRRFEKDSASSERLRLLQMNPDSPEGRDARAQGAARNAAIQQHHDSGEAKRDLATRPKGSLEVAMLSKQIHDVEQVLAAKHARVDALTKELQQLRQHAQESIGLRSNNLRRQSLLLK